MDDRARALLKALIERYIADGQPVGSRTLSKVSDLSPATIRNVMADLEELGLIHSPHTSAGRVPTPRGYRMFVDSLLAVRAYFSSSPPISASCCPCPSPAGRSTRRRRCCPTSPSSPAWCSRPKRTQIFRQIEFIRLSDKRVLLIIVTPEGDVQNRILSAQRDYTEAELLEAGNFFNVHFSGKSFDAVRRTLSTELAQLRDDISRLMQAAVEAGAEAADDGEAVVISGERKLLDVTDIASDMDRLRKMFSLFEKKTDLLQLLDVSSRAQGCRSTSAAIRSWCRWKKCRSSRRRTAWMARSSARWGHRPYPDGVRAGHPHCRHHCALAVQRLEPQPIIPFRAGYRLRAGRRPEVSSCFFACSSTFGPNAICPKPRAGPFRRKPAAMRTGARRRAAGQPGHPDEPTRGAIRRYLGEFLSDPRVIEIPRYLSDAHPARAGIGHAAQSWRRAMPASGWRRARPCWSTARGRPRVRQGLAARGVHAEVELAMRYGKPSIPAAITAFARARLRSHPGRAAVPAIRGQHHGHGGRCRDATRGACATSRRCASSSASTTTRPTSRRRPDASPNSGRPTAGPRSWS